MGAQHELLEAWDEVDVVVFCAGARADTCVEIDERQTSQIVDVNLRSVYHGLGRVIPDLRAAGTGAGTGGKRGWIGGAQCDGVRPDQAAALINLAELLRRSARRRGGRIWSTRALCGRR